MFRKNPHAVALGRLGGKATSPAKTAAVRRNARLGGRAMKFNNGDRVTANDKAPGDYEGRTGTVRSYVRPGQYDVLFGNDGTGNAPTGVLMSSWLDRAKDAAL